MINPRLPLSELSVMARHGLLFLLARVLSMAKANEREENRVFE
jgi:hypothetical protein